VEDRAESERRYGILEPIIVPEKFGTLWRECGGQRGKLIDFLAAQHRISRRTLYTWWAAWKTGGLSALVKRDRSDKGRPQALNSAALDLLLAAALPKAGAYGEMSVREIHRAYKEESTWRAAHANVKLTEAELEKYARYVDPASGCLGASAQLPEVSYNTLVRWYGRIPEVVRVMGREGQESFANSQEVISFRDLTSIQPMQYLVADHRMLDLFALVRNGRGWKLVRPWLTAALDFRTRKWLAWAIVETPSSDSIASVLKRVFLRHGLPGAVLWDNGKDFTCEWLEGRREKSGQPQRLGALGEGMRGVMETLGVRVHHAIVKRARAKIIEPCFLATALFDKTLPWWCGNTPQARPERLEELIDQHERWLKGEAAEPAFPTIESVAALYGEFLESLNEREHSGEGMRGIGPTGRRWLAPNEVWQREIAKVPRRPVPAELIQFAFRRRRTVRVQHGEARVTFGGRQCHYRLAGEALQMMGLNGRTVQIAYDPYDLEMVVVYLDGGFVGLAENVALRRMGEQDFVADERGRRVARREVKRFIDAVHQVVYVPGAVERAARRLEVRPTRIEPVRAEVAVELPAALVAAAEAARQLRAPVEKVQIKRISVGSDDGDEDAFIFFREGVS